MENFGGLLRSGRTDEGDGGSVARSFWCNFGLWFASILRKEHRAKRTRQDDAIEPHGPVADVPGSELDALIESKVISAADLPKSCHTGARGDDGREIDTDAGTLLRKIRAGADQTHVSF
jgi:hypothetical protein